MKTTGITWAVCVAIIAAGWARTPTVQAATKAEQARTAANLVEQTLQREAAGDVDDRGELLKPAIAQTPPFEAAYWQSGFIYDAKRKEWLRWDEVPPLAAKDSRLASYQKTREKCPETIDGQMGLVRWCSKRKMEDQARAHLTRVLEFNPDHAEARQRLGFRSVNGTWVDEHEIAEAQTLVREASAAAAKWVPRLEGLRDRMAGRNADQQEKAKGELAAIRDADAAQAIDTVFCRQTSEMALLGIELLKNIHARQAATVLAWHAVFSPWPQVAQAAATALRSQEKHDYVPLLLAAAQAPVGPQSQVGGNPNNPNAPNNASGAGNSDSPNMRMRYRLDHTVNTYCWNTSEHLQEHPYWQQVPQMRFDPNSPDPVAKTTNKTLKKGASSYNIQKREYYTVKGDRLQERRTENKVTVDKQTITKMGPYPYPRNSQVKPYPQQPNMARSGSENAARKTSPCSVLAEATGENGPSSLSEWWDWWYDFNEIYLSSDKSPDAPDQPKANAPAGGEADVQRGDCLAAGTLVCAETGLTAIEKVGVGDRVFCCDPETGCVALKPVLRITVRPEGRLLKICAGGEEFEASGGHVFWVAGRGWVKARDLRKGMHLHTIRGTASVEGVESGELQTSYSLVAADFHTFFAGKAMVLTHDNTICTPTDCVVPGLAAKTKRPADP
jgi:hypothetical protein